MENIQQQEIKFDFLQIRKPKLDNIEFIAMNLTAEYMGIHYESQLFRCIYGTHISQKKVRSVFNCRKRGLFPIDNLRIKLAGAFSEEEDMFIIDITPVSVHDINMLKDVKIQYSDCTLLGEMGYLSVNYQLDLFHSSQIALETPMRKKPFVFRRSRKRIETLFPQLCDQFRIRQNFAKSFSGFKNRILSKIKAATLIQYLNKLVFNRPINKLKANLS